MKPTLVLVGADKGGVGKTTISRAVLDFLARKNVLARAFDTENPRGTLHRFYPNTCEVIDLNAVADQMKVLDTMETSNVPVTVVDLKAGNLSRSLDTFERIGVLEAARDGHFNLALMHVVGPSVASLDEINEISKYINGIDYVVARNFINETNFFEWDEQTYKRYFSNLNGASEVDVPKLNEMAYEQVDLAGVTFNNFIANKAASGRAGKFSFVLRGYVRKWTSEIEAELEKLRMMKEIFDSGNEQSEPESQSAAADAA